MVSGTLLHGALLGVWGLTYRPNPVDIIHPTLFKEKLNLSWVSHIASCVCVCVHDLQCMFLLFLNAVVPF